MSVVITTHLRFQRTHCFSSANRSGRATAFSPDNEAKTEAMVPSALAFGALSKVSLMLATVSRVDDATEYLLRRLRDADRKCRADNNRILSFSDDASMLTVVEL